MQDVAHSSLCIQSIHAMCILLSSLDKHFAKFIMRHATIQSDALHLAALLVSNAFSNGNVCFDLTTVANSPVTCNELPTLTQCPELDKWVYDLMASGVVGEKGQFVPLILIGYKLYTHRFYSYETIVAEFIANRACENTDAELSIDVSNKIDALFPIDTLGETNWQRLAAAKALQGTFTVISGGPGTGKTTTIAKIISLFLKDLQQHSFLTTSGGSSLSRIALAAPTGKAANRLKTAVSENLAKLNPDESLINAISSEAYTIHRLLGVIPHSPLFRHHKDNPLPFDLVIVDEASMIDLSLMAALINAISDKTRLILLGDKDQLSSVEAGSVFGDICNTGENKSADSADTRSPLAKRIVQLKKSYRFSSESGIGKLSACINAGQADAAWRLLTNRSLKEVALHELPEPKMLSQTLGHIVLNRFNAYAATTSFTQAYSLFESFRVLCGLRNGPYGVENINRLIELLLEEERIIPRNAEWYHGRPVMVTRNDPGIGLYNGDIGLVMNDALGKQQACFTGDTPDTTRSFFPLRLPAHETAYATTVHKSQGSEFGHVILLLPQTDSPVLTRELLYTAITRAKESVEIWCNEGVFKNAVNRRVVRMSGLQERLWGSW